MLILILSVISVILIFLIIFLGCRELLGLISGICSNCRKFVIENSGFFTILFLVIFFLEQALLIILIFSFFSVPYRLQIIISIFALIVVTTATLQKFVWEYKFHALRGRVISTGIKNKVFLLEMKELINENEELRMKLKKQR